MPCAATRRCSRATTRSRRSGASATRSCRRGRECRGRCPPMKRGRRVPSRQICCCARAIDGGPFDPARLMSDVLWSAQGTTPDAIEDALRELLAQRHAENPGFVSARVLNMIAFVDREWSGEIANRLSGVGRYHASRLLVLSYEPRRERLDARVTIASEEPAPGELGLLHETVVVELGHRHLDDLLTIADPLVVTDLPTLLWSPHGHPDAVDALLPLAQAVLVDSVDEPVWREAIDRECSLTDQA